MAARKPKKPTSSTSARPKPRRKSRYGRKSTGGTAIKHTCGHTQRHALTGLKWKQERELVRQKGLVCTKCYGEAKVIEMEALAEIDDLPPLEGSPKQILWARSVRGLQLFRIRMEMAGIDPARHKAGLSPAVTPIVQKAIEKALKQCKAKWWIDHRDDEKPLRHFLTEKQYSKIEAASNELAEMVRLAAPGPDCPF